MATRWDETQRRWLVDGEAVHAGAAMEMQGRVPVGHDDDGDPRTEPGEWFTVRIESRDGGRVLDAYAEVHGVMSKCALSGLPRREETHCSRPRLRNTVLQRVSR